MLSLEIMLKALEQNHEIMCSTLNSEEIDQVVAILSQIAKAEEEQHIKKAKDDLFNFCLKFPLLRELFAKADRSKTSHGQRLNPEPISKQVRLIADRIIKAVQEPQKKSQKSENKR